MADPQRPPSTPAPRPPNAPANPDAERHASVLEVIGRKGGAPPKVLLRDSPSEHGGTPILDAASPEARQVPAGRGNYEFHGEIARGGMGVILKGHDRDLGRDVAVKVLKKDLAQRQEIVARFVEEAQIGGQLQHPGIVPVYELGLMADERPYFTMKLVKGRTLSALLSERAAPDADRARFLGIFEQVCQTMAYAHSKGVIHRDLKPANVMVGAFGEVQVLDWGLAKVLAQGGVADEKRERDRTTHATIIETLRHRHGSKGSDSLAGSVMGTPAYMPPEQARGEIDRLDERSDVFSLGAILCEILTGRPIYGGEPEELMTHAANAELAGATQRLEGCGADADLVALAKKCLAPAPAARPRHAGVLAKELAAWRTTVDERVRTAQIAAAEARVKAEDERRARRLTLALAATIVVAAVAGGGGWVAWSARQQKWREEAELRLAQTESGVNGALAEAALARGKKEWAVAIASMERALAISDAGPPDAQRRARVLAQVDAVSAEAAAAQRQADLERENRELLAHLLELRTSGFGRDDLQERDEALVDAFSAYGLEIDALSVEEAALAIEQRGIGVAVAPELDEWAWLRTERGLEEDADHVMRLSERIDDDPVRRRLRVARRIGDRALLKEFQRTEDLDALPASSLCLLASSFVRASDRTQAARVLRRSRVLHPGDFTTCMMLADLLRDGNDPREDEESLQCDFAALALQPGHARLHAGLGATLVSTSGDAERGLELLRRAVELDPRDGWIRRRFGWALLDSGDFRGSVEQQREAVRLEPQVSWHRAALGIALMEHGDVAAALAELKEAVRLGPANEEAREHLTTTLLRSGDLQGARDEHAAVSRLSPRLVFWMWNTALLNTASGDRAAARRAIEEALRRTSRTSMEALLFAAEYLLEYPDPELRDPARAAEFAWLATQRSPRSAWAWELHGAALYRRGDWENSVESSLRAREYAAGGSAVTRLYLALGLSQLGRRIEAHEHYRAAVEWIEQQQNRNAEILTLRDEAARQLGIETGEQR